MFFNERPPRKTAVAEIIERGVARGEDPDEAWGKHWAWLQEQWAAERREAKVIAWFVLRVLRTHGFAINPTIEERINSCGKIDRQLLWLDRASVAERLDEVFA